MSNFLIIEANIMKLMGFKKPGEIIKFIGVTQSAYYNWRDREEIPPKQVMRIAKLMKVPVEKITQKEGEIETKEDVRMEDIVNLLRDDPAGMDAVFHFLEAKKNFDRASKSMKQYLGKKLEVWFEFPSAGNGEPKGKGGPK